MIHDTTGLGLFLSAIFWMLALPFLLLAVCAWILFHIVYFIILVIIDFHRSKETYHE